MATTKTDYQAALAHKYRVETGGETVPGVTTILGIMEKPGLKWGASAVGARVALDNAGKVRSIANRYRKELLTKGGDRETRNKNRLLAQEGTDRDVFLHWCRGAFQREWNAKANRGTRVHKVAEEWSKNPEAGVKVLPEDSKYVDSLERFHTLYKPRFIYTECIVLNPFHRYGGRFDGVMELDGPGAEGVFMGDYKTGGEWMMDVAIQEEGYMNGLLATFNPDGSLGPMKSLPRLDGSRVIYLRDDGTVGVKDPFEIITREQAWRAFLASKALYDVQKEINQLLKESDYDD